MRWYCGFSRLWLLLTLLWVALVGTFSCIDVWVPWHENPYNWPLVGPGISSGGGGYAIEFTRAYAPLVLDPGLHNYAWIAIVPPLGLLCLGRAVGWYARAPFRNI
jgi:hypothetical protein